jgi:hypothetical protein
MKGISLGSLMKGISLTFSDVSTKRRKQLSLTFFLPAVNDQIGQNFSENAGNFRVGSFYSEAAEYLRDFCDVA